MSGGGDELQHKLVTWTKTLAICTGLLFLASVVSSYFVWGQYRALNDQLQDTREQLRASVLLQNINEIISVGKEGKVQAYLLSPVFYNSGGTRTAHFNAWVSVKYF